MNTGNGAPNDPKPIHLVRVSPHLGNGIPSSAYCRPALYDSWLRLLKSIIICMAFILFEH